MQDFVIRTKTVEQLKQKARKLKRKQSISHADALDQAAKWAGFEHWHHVTLSHEKIKPAEIAFSTGCILVFDAKESLDVDTSDGVIIQDHLLESVCRSRIHQLFVNGPDEDDPDERPLKVTRSERDLNEWFADVLADLMFFRMREDEASSSIENIITLIRQRAFWLPQFLFIQGKLVNTQHLLPEDEDGNIIGIRF